MFSWNYTQLNFVRGLSSVISPEFEWFRHWSDQKLFLLFLFPFQLLCQQVLLGDVLHHETRLGGDHEPVTVIRRRFETRGRSSGQTFRNRQFYPSDMAENYIRFLKKCFYFRFLNNYLWKSINVLFNLQSFQTLLFETTVLETRILSRDCWLWKRASHSNNGVISSEKEL